MRIALTIAGSDSSGGAGIQADLKSFAAQGVFGASVLTALTAQNTLGVQSVHMVPPEFIAAQIDAVCADFNVHGTKTGMLASAEIVHTVALKVQEWDLGNLVVDPVMVAKSGSVLLAAEAIAALRAELLPLALIVTPNIPEAGVLCGRHLDAESEEDLKSATREIFQMGSRYVLLKGGHRAGDATDILFDGKNFETFNAPRIDTKHTHGTGCTLSAAIAALLAKGQPVPLAVENAKQYITAAIAQAPGLGKGNGPLQHFPEDTPLLLHEEKNNIDEQDNQDKI
jgi:hydroxymethylpyrimidine/phosphomethylpyrimidine kinase